MDPISAITVTQANGTQPAAQAMQASQGATGLDAPRGLSVDAAEIGRASVASAAPSPIADAAGRVMGNIHSTVERLGREIDMVETAAPSAAEDAKSALTPQSADLAPGGPAPADGTPIDGPDSNLAMLNKSFDHAMFMAMINQVISGVGDSSRTLIRQA